ncbi:hypothetical protein GDO78_022427 [Eleutherodactylus coqui]|uniref:Uncharacterized protein n=1 Tax=Eleutherodactylus coqui TaxID=57060 RepID=A0A8J6EC64_ELECQ|nr:hypothetical protein GDO78_022427 [Eleutherodactylus coqui]
MKPLLCSDSKFANFGNPNIQADSFQQVMDLLELLLVWGRFDWWSRVRLARWRFWRLRLIILLVVVPVKKPLLVLNLSRASLL